MKIDEVGDAITAVLDGLADARNYHGFSEQLGRAAIEAMREPTIEMFEAAGYREGMHIWRAMIDAALAQSPQERDNG